MIQRKLLPLQMKSVTSSIVIMNENSYNKFLVVEQWNGIVIYSKNGKYGLHHPENDIFVSPIYDKIEWDKSSDFIVVTLGGNVGFLSADDGHFIDINDKDPEDPYMLAIPYEVYMKQEWPEWIWAVK